MSEGFLDRWSRRKRTADLPKQEEPASEPPSKIEAEEEVPADLPDPESLTAESDITVFLRKGVPAALRNAALRRMWALDPVISNHRDVAVDYAWDWNTPGGVPGNGVAPAPETIQRMVRDLLEPRQELPPSPVEQAMEEGPKQPDPLPADERKAALPTPDPEVLLEEPPRPPRRHGGARPV